MKLLITLISFTYLYGTSWSRNEIEQIQQIEKQNYTNHLGTSCNKDRDDISACHMQEFCCTQLYRTVCQRADKQMKTQTKRLILYCFCKHLMTYKKLNYLSFCGYIKYQQRLRFEKKIQLHESRKYLKTQMWKCSNNSLSFLTGYT